MTGPEGALFEPIAIVGRSCVLPGAPNPEALWEAVATGRDLVSAVPADRWGLQPEHALTSDPSRSDDRAWSDRGGYVSGFDAAFRAELQGDPFSRDADDLLALDPLFHWVLHCGRTALRQAGHEGASDRVAAVLGNLSFPSSAMSRRDEPYFTGRAVHAGLRITCGDPVAAPKLRGTPLVVAAGRRDHRAARRRGSCSMKSRIGDGQRKRPRSRGALDPYATVGVRNVPH